MIRHIVFDMGQVLVQFSAGLFSERLRLSAEDAELIRREVLTTVEWVRMDRGTISDDDALARINAVNAFLRQGLDEKSTFEETLQALYKVVA